MINQMREATRRFEHGIETALQPFALTLPQFDALAALHRNLDSDLPVGDLAQLLSCTRSNLTGICDRLEARGLIDRVRSNEDRRVVYIRLTAGGREIAADAVEEVNTYLLATGDYVFKATGFDTECVSNILDVINKQGVPA